MTKTTKWSVKQVEKLQHWEFPGGYSAHETSEDCTFDAKFAAQAVNFGPTFFQHVKGAKGGEPIFLEEHQAAFIANLFGWKQPDGLRRYRTCYREIPRGNGKSTECVVIAGILLYLDDEPGADIFSAAGTRDQAREVFGPFKTNVLGNPSLSEISQTYQNSVVRLDENTGLPCGNYKAIAADADFNHGGSPHGVIFDELHVQPNRDLWDVLQTGKIKRRQPLTIAITTAGWDRNSICWEQRQYAESVRDGTITDKSFFPIIYCAEPTDDWTDPAVWRKANPNLGVSIKECDFAAECEKARQLPSYENTFKRLHLNIWTEQAIRWIPMNLWDECLGDVPDLRGQSCCAGLDMSSTQDVTAFVMVFRVDDDSFAVLPRFWIPEATAAVKERTDHVPYRLWAQQGLVTLTEGNRVDHAKVRDDILKLRDEYNILEIAFDPWNAGQISTELQNEGLTITEFRQGYATMSPAAKAFERMVLGKQLRHGGNPVLRWMASNVAIQRDHAENIKPVKDKSTGRIDGIVAAVMAVGRAATAQPAQEWWSPEDGVLL